MLIEGKTPFEFAREWYPADEIFRSINRRVLEPGRGEKIPPNITSPEFAEWLSTQYVLAMVKGMELAERALKELVES